MESLLHWSIANTDPNAPRPSAERLQALDPGIIDHILGKSDAVLMREAAEIALDENKSEDQRALALEDLEMVSKLLPRTLCLLWSWCMTSSWSKILIMRTVSIPIIHALLYLTFARYGRFEALGAFDQPAQIHFIFRAADSALMDFGDRSPEQS
jgi:hypothetical protein